MNSEASANFEASKLNRSVNAASGCWYRSCRRASPHMVLALSLVAAIGCSTSSVPPPAASDSADRNSVSTGPKSLTAGTAGIAGTAREPATNTVVEPGDRMSASEVLSLNDLPWPEGLDRLTAAERLTRRGQHQEAIASLDGVEGTAAVVLRARAMRLAGRFVEAASLLEAHVSTEAMLAPILALEKGLVAAAADQHALAVTLLLPLLNADHAIASRAAMPLVNALRHHGPQVLLDQQDAIKRLLPDANEDAHSLFLDAVASAHEQLKQPALAQALRLKRHLELPVSTHTPDAPPAGIVLTAEQRLARAELLLDAHRSERTLADLRGVDRGKLDATQLCRLRFAAGLAHRKLHHYRSAEKDLTWVAAQCDDNNLARRALYLNAKVISIASGLRAVPVIDQFAKRFVGHSMVDDVLFWAGDLYQRRGRYKEASKFYERIETLPKTGDHCADARWRRAWMASRQGRTVEAIGHLKRTFVDDGCAPGVFERARARYWLGNMMRRQGKADEAVASFETVIKDAPLGIYALMALRRLRELNKTAANRLAADMRAPDGDAVPALCPGKLASDANFRMGLKLALAGLHEDARSYLLAIDVNEQKVVGKAHAVSQGIDSVLPGAASAAASKPEDPMCDPMQGRLLLALLLDRVGAQREAHWRLRTEFADALTHMPTSENVGLFRAAYPLAYHSELGAAEEESELPPLLLQALSREESAFDPDIVSWAGAYGLTQLLLVRGQAAGRMLSPPVSISKAEQLMDAKLNARLGAVLMGSHMRRYREHPALSLVAYNSTERFATTLHKRHAEHDFDRFTEEISIRETRTYVKRVIRTYGIYRWLYAEHPPELPFDFPMPAYN